MGMDIEALAEHEVIQVEIEGLVSMLAN